jgi:hypothetical protein
MAIGSICSCGVDASVSDTSSGVDSTEDAVKHVSSATVCGGLLGLSCLAGQTCIDDPSDKCDPASGGKDCRGLCVVPTGVNCGGLAGMACPAAQSCISATPGKQGADFIGTCAAKPTCGGFAHLGCPAKYTCIDDPSDSCDPAKKGKDCAGLCVLN